MAGAMIQPSQSFLAVDQMLDERHPQAIPQLAVLAKQGDPYALMQMGEFLLIGKWIRRDPERGFKFISRAAKAGLIEAQRSEIYLTARGVGRKANPRLALNKLSQLAETDRFAAVQRQLLDHAESRQRLADIEPEIISEDPSIRVWRGLFSQAEYGYLRRIGEPKLEPAMVVDPATGSGRLDPIRKSDTCSFTLIYEDLLVQEILRTIAEATDTAPDQGEPLSVLRYPVGGEYRKHYDAYGGDWKGTQRLYTALIWLNDDYEGGETHFPRLDLKVRGQAGDMLVFANLLPDRTRDDRMEHAGLPVTRGEKWLASRWITVADTPQ